jgi:hypothetical protein
MNGNHRINGVQEVAQNGEKPRLKFLFVSWESLSGDLAWRIKQDGHDVKFWSKDSDDQDMFEGFLEKN